MLGSVDKGLAILSWVAAAAVAVMLLFGPAVIAHDSAKKPAKSPYQGGAAAPTPGAATATPAADGQALFKSKCGSCHTLSAAGTSGSVGPKLDGLGLSVATVEAKMKSGGGVMPSFSSLSAGDSAALAKFVADSSK